MEAATTGVREQLAIGSGARRSLETPDLPKAKKERTVGMDTHGLLLLEHISRHTRQEASRPMAGCSGTLQSSIAFK